ncbi:hypothetical protein Mal4_50740 [Maioricimonas rarisocia]|uniref:Uncharacterized protein n=1 Tax=Maioricimonas rarisocia TaxID=2528026 RepID=A0A517ZE23_9PLAN|nr:hypothetical protein Mal4_50740 [Maioricimonas rarisocia]
MVAPKDSRRLRKSVVNPATPDINCTSHPGRTIAVSRTFSEVVSCAVAGTPAESNLVTGCPPATVWRDSGIGAGPAENAGGHADSTDSTGKAWRIGQTTVDAFHSRGDTGWTRNRQHPVIRHTPLILIHSRRTPCVRRRFFVSDSTVMHATVHYVDAGPGALPIAVPLRKNRCCDGPLPSPGTGCSPGRRPILCTAIAPMLRNVAQSRVAALDTSCRNRPHSSPSFDQNRGRFSFLRRGTVIADVWSRQPSGSG